MPFHVKTVLLGRTDGNFRSISSENNERIVDAAHQRGCRIPKTIYIPRLAFTTRIRSCIGEASNSCAEKQESPSDAVLISGTECAAAIPVGDCLVTCISSENILAVLHTGYRNMIPADGSDSIIVNVLREAFFRQRNTIHVRICPGIGPCCYAAGHWPEVQNRNPLVEPYVECTTRGPYIGMPSLDLPRLARDQCIQEGIPHQSITIQRLCTSCAQKNDTYLYWSHMRAKDIGQQDKEGRNLLIAYLVESP